MRFYKKQGKQMIDTTGDLILTKNETLVSCSSKSALPAVMKGGHAMRAVKGNRIKATFTALRFIWGE